MFNYEYPPLGGGAANATEYILRALSNIPNLEIDLITSSLAEQRLEKFSESITIHYLDIGGVKNLNYQPLQKLLRFAFSSYWYAREHLQDIDLIHAFFGIPSGFTALFFNSPFIVSLRGSDVPFYNKRFALLDRLLFKNLSKIIWRKAAFTVANSEGLRQLALKSSPRENISLIPNGVDIDFYYPQKEKQKNNTFTIISVGRLIPRKGFDLLIKALRNVDGVCLQIAGGGVIQEELISLGKECNVDLQLLGQLTKSELREALQKADLFVLASYNEGMSNAALEALACGLPLVLSDVGGSSELIKNNGVIVPVGSVVAIHEQIIFYKENEGERIRHSECSRKLAEKMSWEQVALRYAEMYNAIQNKNECVE